MLAGAYYRAHRRPGVRARRSGRTSSARAGLDRRTTATSTATASSSTRAQRPSGLVQQGWKDSSDSVFHADGALRRGPDRAVRGPGLRLRRLRRGRRPGRRARRRGARRRAAGAQAERAARAVRGGVLVRGAGDLRAGPRRRQAALPGARPRTPGHCLWTGIVEPERAPRRSPARCCPTPVFSGWGIRTLAAGEARYNPMSYHNGSVWPHDNAIIAAGLARYGLTRRGRCGILRRPVRRAPLLRPAADARAVLRLPAAPGRGARRCTRWPAPRRRGRRASVFMLLQAASAWASTRAPARCASVTPRCRSSISDLRLEDLRVGDARLDLLLERRGDDVGVSILRRTGHVGVVVAK